MLRSALLSCCLVGRLHRNNVGHQLVLPQDQAVPNLLIGRLS